jgi:hypothetical protein
LIAKFIKFSNAVLFLANLYTFIPPNKIDIKNAAKSASVNAKRFLRAKVITNEKVITLKNR